MRRAVIGYFPVLHQGVLTFLEKELDETTCLLLPDEEVLGSMTLLHKNLPALKVDKIRSALRGIFLNKRIKSVNTGTLIKAAADKFYDEFIVPNEEVSLLVAKAFLPENLVRIVDVFIRYDRSRSTNQDLIDPDSVISTDEALQILMVEAKLTARNSSDFWRQVGCLLVRKGEILIRAFNQYRPDALSAYAYGDPRSLFSRGQEIETSLAIHAEQAVIGNAARLGIATNGCDLVVTTFPCPVCAKLIAETGIRRVVYLDGYSKLDSVLTLRSRNIELIRVIN